MLATWTKTRYMSVSWCHPILICAFLTSDDAMKQYKNISDIPKLTRNLSRPPSMPS